MKVKVSELIGVALDWAVAECLGSIGQAPSRCCDCPHFRESAIQDGADYHCYLGDLDWCDGYASDHPFGDGICATYGVHQRCSLKLGTLADPYSTDWSHGGPILDTMFAEYQFGYEDGEYFVGNPGLYLYGPTSLVAAMRCLVASELGKEIEVPDELVGAVAV